MTKPSSVKRTFMNHVLKQVEEHGEEQLRFARYDRVLGDPDWQRVHRIADLESATLLKRYASKLSSPNASTADLGELGPPFLVHIRPAGSASEAGPVPAPER